MKVKPELTKEEITQGQLADMLFKVKGSKFATLVTSTQLKMRKTNNPFADRDVVKVATTNVTMNFNFANSSQKKGVKLNGNKRIWGERIGITPILINKGETYLHSKQNAKPQKVTYFLDGEEMNDEQIRVMNQFVQHRAPSPVPVMDVKLDNIREIKIDKKHFIVK